MIGVATTVLKDQARSRVMLQSCNLRKKPQGLKDFLPQQPRQKHQKVYSEKQKRRI